MPRRFGSIVVVIAMALVAAAWGGSSSKKPSTGATKVTKGGTYAIVLPSSHDDKEFGQAGYEGLQQAVKKLGAKSIYLENVPVANAEEAFRNLASQKPKVVIGLGGQFADAGAAVASQFPDVQFVVINGTKTGANLSKWSQAEGEVAYLGGIMVAATLHPAKLGRIAGIQIPPLQFASAGFIDGARTIDPNISYVSTFTGDMDDVAKAKEATLAAFQAGAKVVYVGMNNGIVGQEQAAQQANGLLVNNVFNKCQDPRTGKLYYGNAVTSTTFAVNSVVLGLANGSLKPGFSKTNLQYPAAFQVGLCKGSLPSDVQTKIADARQKLLSGQITVGLQPAKP